MYNISVLENGIRIVTEHMHSVRSVAIGAWLPVGTRYEQKKKMGMAHLLEHMLFKGTRQRTAYDIAVCLESLGGQLNGFTERELTCIYAIVLEDNLDDAVDLLADLLLNSLFDPSHIETEKQIILEEIRNLQDSPEDLVQEYLLETVFGNHPLGFSALGSARSVQSITRDEIHRFYKDYYTAGELVISAAGAVQHDMLTARIQTALERWKAGPPAAPDPFRTSPPGEKAISASVSQSHIAMGSPLCGYGDPRKFHCILLNTYMGAGMSSHLFQVLREYQGLAYAVYSYLDFWSDTGLWTVYAGTSAENRQQVIDTVRRALERISGTGLAGNELERLKQQIVRGLILGYEDPVRRMSRIAKMAHYRQPYLSIEQVSGLIQDLQNDALIETMKSLDIQNRLYLTVIEP